MLVLKSYLNQLQHSLCIKIPDGVKSFSFLAAQENIMNGDGFIDTEDDSGEVEEEEHDDGGNQNSGIVDNIILITHSPHLWFSTLRTICLVLEKNGRQVCKFGYSDRDFFCKR